MSTSTLSLRRRLRLGGAGGSRDEGVLRIAIVAETFLPAVNGVTNSVVQVATHMRDRGHDVLIIAPGPGDTDFNGCPVIRVPSVELPHYRDLRIGRPSRIIGSALRDFRPDVVHVAAPLGRRSRRARGRRSWTSSWALPATAGGLAFAYGAVSR